MNYVEYGKENSDVIILLHGGGLSWWNYKEVAERLQTDYHVVLPILDGHAGCDKQFTTIENNALDIIEFVNSKLGGSVLMMGGLSLGGQILLEILFQRKDICKYAIVESVLVIPSKFTYSMIKPAFGSCYGLIKYKWFSKLQFKSLRIKSNLFDEYYKDTCAIRKSDMIAFLQENSVYSLKDGIGECEASALRSFCLHKHAWKLIDSLDGANASAIIYSITETAKANDLNPFRYLEHVLTVLKDHQDDREYGFIDDILPWSEKLPAICRSKTKATNI